MAGPNTERDRLAVNFRVVAILFIAAEMAQHRIMTILLFVCLSFCFEVAQSKLKDGDPCIYSADCGSRCCHRDSPKGSGKCVQKSMGGVRCYGPNNGNPCFRSHQCNSGCCMPGTSVYNAFCVPKYDNICLGPNFEDFCYSSDQCHSGCCYNLETLGKVPICVRKSEYTCLGAEDGNYCVLSTLCKSGCCRSTSVSRTYQSGKCGPKAAENEECNLEPDVGLYDYCPCESGLVCEKGIPRDLAVLLKDLEKASQVNMMKLLLNVTNRRICRKPNTANN
ncbi:phosphatidylinositol-glycan biosynthesis class W protein isoform X3 [Eleutherodactylus coqui]|uniref:phosphatidylinositol-glycan biosynthesis class W protein isoform X3 n=1 Tax=Eleutherodactylus coqui TaxID=57060 RepID=UPI0034618892